MKAPKFCWNCGGDIIKVNERVSRYDDQTRRPIFDIHLKCSKKRWWKIFGSGLCFDEYDEFEGYSNE